MITLDQAKELVRLLESGNQEEADNYVMQITSDMHDPLFNEVGKLTRQLHDSLVDFRLDPRVGSLANDEIPHAKDRLNFVIEKTEDAANRTMDAVDVSVSIATKIQTELAQLRPQWNRLMDGSIDLATFKTMCQQLDQHMQSLEQSLGQLQSQMTEILMAQDFQDLTGQVIRKVIELVHEVESQLIDVLSAFGMHDDDEPQSSQHLDTIRAEGPVVTQEKRQEKNILESQDDVDDLLTSLGF